MSTVSPRRVLALRIALPFLTAGAIGVLLAIGSRQLQWSGTTIVVVGSALVGVLALFGAPLVALSLEAADRTSVEARSIEARLHRAMQRPMYAGAGAIAHPPPEQVDLTPDIAEIFLPGGSGQEVSDAVMVTLHDAIAGAFDYEAASSTGSHAVWVSLHETEHASNLSGDVNEFVDATRRPMLPLGPLKPHGAV